MSGNTTRKRLRRTIKHWKNVLRNKTQNAKISNSDSRRCRAKSRQFCCSWKTGRRIWRYSRTTPKFGRKTLKNTNKRRSCRRNALRKRPLKTSSSCRISRKRRRTSTRPSVISKLQGKMPLSCSRKRRQTQSSKIIVFILVYLVNLLILFF